MGHEEPVGSVTRAQVAEIAEMKMKDLNARTVEAREPHHRRNRTLGGHRRRRLSAMAKHSKRFRSAYERIDRDRTYQPKEALDLLKQLPAPKFDETVDVVVKLGIDPAQDRSARARRGVPAARAGQEREGYRLRRGRQGRRRDRGRRRRGGQRGAGGKIQGGWMDFDIVIASPDMMKHVGKLGKVLGPQGKMPSPKSGTVTPDVAKAVSEFKAGKVEFRTDSGGNVHAPVGKRSFEVDHLEENLVAFLDHLNSLRPPAVRGEFLNKISVSTTMGPGAWITYGS